MLSGLFFFFFSFFCKGPDCAQNPNSVKYTDTNLSLSFKRKRSTPNLQVPHDAGGIIGTGHWFLFHFSVGLKGQVSPLVHPSPWQRGSFPPGSVPVLAVPLSETEPPRRKTYLGCGSEEMEGFPGRQQDPASRRQGKARARSTVV